MDIKKSYKPNDIVWIYGIGGPQNKLTQGKIIKVMNLTDVGHSAGPYYIVEIPTHIDSLLEIRTWDTISQDNNGPVGAFRDLGDITSTIKKSKQVGFSYDEIFSDADDSFDDVHPDTIHAALEKSQEDGTYKTLTPRAEKPKRRPYYKKKTL